MAAKLKNDGGRAFPRQELWLQDGSQNFQQDHGSAGMTLRDYFAAKALPSLVSVSAAREDSRTQSDRALAKRIAKYAYIVADAMIAEREK